MIGLIIAAIVLGCGGRTSGNIIVRERPKISKNMILPPPKPTA